MIDINIRLLAETKAVENQQKISLLQSKNKKQTSTNNNSIATSTTTTKNNNNELNMLIVEDTLEEDNEEVSVEDMNVDDSLVPFDSILVPNIEDEYLKSG